MAKFVWSPIIWKDGRRKSDNFLESAYLALDFEDYDYSLERALHDFCDMAHVIGTTRNHRIAKDRTPAVDRFRILIPWERPISDKLEYEYNMAKIVGEYDCDKKCKDAARFFYPCKEIVSINLDGYSYEIKPTPNGWTKNSDARKYENAELGIPSRFCKKWLTRVIPIGERNTTCYRLGADLSRMGLSYEECLDKVLKSPTYRHTDLTPRRRGEIEDAILNGFKKERS
jgi:hypothetical protein